MSDIVRIIGIDPGLRRCGWGIVESAGNRLSVVAAGTVKPDVRGELAIRLKTLFEELSAVIQTFRPDEAAVEETFVSAGARSALLLGQARGIALVAPAVLGLCVGEYAANLVKKSIVGSGHADKHQMQMMVKMLLPSADFNGADEADALAIAICHAHHRSGPEFRKLSA